MKYFSYKWFSVFGGAPLITLFLSNVLFILMNIHEKCIVYHFKTLCWFCQQNKVVVYSKALKYLHYKKFVLMKIQKKGLQKWKKLQKTTQISKCPPKKTYEGFSIKKNIDPISFMNRFWLISTKQCFFFNLFFSFVSSGMPLRLSDTTQFIKKNCI